MWGQIILATLSNKRVQIRVSDSNLCIERRYPEARTQEIFRNITAQNNVVHDNSKRVLDCKMYALLRL